MPELAHWFGLTWTDIEGMPFAEVRTYLTALTGLPPIGAVYLKQ